MKILNFVIIKLTVCLITGILLGHFINVNITFLIILIIFLLSVFAFIVFLKSSTKKTIWTGVLVYICTLSIGCLTINIHNQSNFYNHYTQLNDIAKDSTLLIQFRVQKVLKSGKFHHKYVTDILKINEHIVNGRMLLNIDNDSIDSRLKVDAVYFSNTELKELNPPQNPYQFDYKNYLKKQHIYHQLFLNKTNLLKVSSNKHTIYGYAGNLRDLINSKLNQYHFKEDELAIINALLLGQRQDISKDIYSSYTQAGAIHILAVSGLHIGIILYLLNFVFKPIEFIKHGRFIKTVVLVIILWSFAIVAGLSASVVRAVTMFTIVAIAMNLKRPTNIYNTLTISIFILLLFKPTYLFDVGFQLSYLAVFSIVVIQPILSNLWQPKPWLFKFFWNIFTVTIAAQFGIIPISLYYFHQFPGLFLLSNLVIIPFLGLIFGLGLIVIILALTNLLPNILASFFGWVISKMNTFVKWVANQEAFLLEHISFDIDHVLFSYLIIILIINWLLRKSFKPILFLLFSVLCIQCYLLTTKHLITSNTFIVFHKSKLSIIGNQQNRSLTIYSNTNDSLLLHDKMITNYKVGAHLKTIALNSMKNVFRINHKSIFIIDSVGVYNVNTFKPEIILLQQSPKINLARVIDSLQPQLIISDGSNYKSYQDLWQATCKAKKIPFHRTSKKGAFIYSY